MRIFYLLMTVLGLVLPYTVLGTWMNINGFQIFVFIEEILNSKLSILAWIDVVISAIVLIAFILHEGKKINLKQSWIPIVGTILVGVSFGLPLFLYLRELHLGVKREVV